MKLNKMKKLIISGLILTTMSIAIIGCNKEKVEVQETEIVNNNLTEEKIENVISKKIALNINDVNAKNILINELKKEWGGDYQVLFKDLPNNLANLLQNNLNSDEKQWIKRHPKLRLLTTENTISNLSSETNFILVIEPETENTKSIIAFNKDGDKLTLDSEFEPDLQLIIFRFL